MKCFFLATGAVREREKKKEKKKELLVRVSVLVLLVLVNKARFANCHGRPLLMTTITFRLLIRVPSTRSPNAPGIRQVDVILHIRRRPRSLSLSLPHLLRVGGFELTRLRQGRRIRQEHSHTGDRGGQITARHGSCNVQASPRVCEFEVFVCAVACGFGEGEGDGAAELVCVFDGADVATTIANVGWCAGRAGDGVEIVVDSAIVELAVFLSARVDDDGVGGVCGADVGGRGGIGGLSFLDGPPRRLPDEGADRTLRAV